MAYRGILLGLAIPTLLFACSSSDEGDSGEGAKTSGVPLDTDGDGVADGLDTDGDGKIDAPLDESKGTALDTDGDGVADGYDTDGDGQVDKPIDTSGDGDGDTSSGGDGDTSSGGDGDTGGLDCGTESVCSDECVDTMTNDDHCGECGEKCDDYFGCDAGSCVRIACEGELGLCDGDCLDIQTDNNNCGECDKKCELTYACSTGDCDCTDGKTECGYRCTFTTHDRQNCGGCDGDGGAVCGDDEACLSGTCETLTNPSESYCDPADSWAAASTKLEFEILDEVNKRRAEGADCGSEGTFEPTGPLQMDASLQCAARIHSKDMDDDDYFSHYTGGVESEANRPNTRLSAAGYIGGWWGENIAKGNHSAVSVVAGWMNSDGHCSNIMNPDYDIIGVGHQGTLWTQTFGRD